MHALPATALLVQFGNSFLHYTVSCLVEARDSISLHLEKEKSLFHFKEKLNFLHLLNFLFIEQHHHLSGCPRWTDTQHHPSHSLYMQPPSPAEAPSLNTFQNGTSPCSHSKCLVSSLTVFHLAYHNSCLNRHPSPTHLSTHPHCWRHLAFTLPVPTSHPFRPPFTPPLVGSEVLKIQKLTFHRAVLNQ